VSYFQRVEIICPPEIFSTWGTSPIADLFVGGNLQLRIQPSDYTRIEEGGSSEFNDFFNGVGYRQSPQRIGFNIAIQDKRDELALAIKQLSRLSLGTQYRDFKPVTVRDYCRLETPADYTTGYTTRKGRIWVENLTATVNRGKLICATPAVEQPQLARLNQGFNLRFLSSQKEILA
jgi:hypothetical protein